MNAKRVFCNGHSRGVEPGAPPFFVDGCPRCERKKRLGLVTGNEGPMETRAQHVKRTRKWIDWSNINKKRRDYYMVPFSNLTTTKR